MNLFRFVIAAVYGNLSLLSSSGGVITSPTSSTSSRSGSSFRSSTRTTTTLGTTSMSSPRLQHSLSLTMEESATSATGATVFNSFFQIHSSERPDLCIEVFETLEQVGRLWLQPCKTKDDRGVERQTFAITNNGKLHPATKPFSCLFYDNQKNLLRYRKDCSRILHSKKNQFVFNFFDGTIFLTGDSLTKVITVRELQERNEVKLLKGPGSSSKIRKQHWTLHLERDRILQPADCDSPTSKNTPTMSPTYGAEGIPNVTYPKYKVIATKEEYANYWNLWVLNHNVKGENDASKADKKRYLKLFKKYG